LPGETPTLTHVEALGQLTPSSVVFGVGIAFVVHVAPPSLEVTAAPSPTATQSLELWHVTALSSGSPEETVLWLQLDPPSEEVAATPTRLLSPPTATQFENVEHVTELKLPSPVDAPPGIGTVGAFDSLAGTVQAAIDVAKRFPTCEKG
jgi:hypothetical protein